MSIPDATPVIPSAPAIIVDAGAINVNADNDRIKVETIKKSPLIRNVIVFTVFITFYTLAIVGYIHNYKNTNREYNVPDDLIERINEIEKNNHKHNTTDYLIERINGIEENNHKHNTTDHHDTTINDPQIVYEPSHTSVMGHEWIGRGMRLDYGDWRLNVVTPTYTQGKTYQYNDVTYSVPDHMQCQTIPESGEQSMTVRISNLVEYQIQKAAEFGIDANALEIFKAELNADASLVKQTLSVDNSIVYKTERFYALTQCTSVPDISPFLSDEFRTEIESLPTPYDVNNPIHKQRYEVFFSRWGSYVVSQTLLGGRVEASVVISRAESLESEYTAAGISAYVGGVITDWLKASADGEGSVVESSLKTTLSERSSISINTMGGDRTNGMNPIDWTTEQKTHWRNSIAGEPGAIQQRVTPITSAIPITETERYNSMNAAINHIFGTRNNTASSFYQMRDILINHVNQLIETLNTNLNNRIANAGVEIDEDTCEQGCWFGQTNCNGACNLPNGEICYAWQSSLTDTNHIGFGCPADKVMVALQTYSQHTWELRHLKATCCGLKPR